MPSFLNRTDRNQFLGRNRGVSRSVSLPIPHTKIPRPRLLPGSFSIRNTSSRLLSLACCPLLDSALHDHRQKEGFGNCEHEPFPCSICFSTTQLQGPPTPDDFSGSAIRASSQTYITVQQRAHGIHNPKHRFPVDDVLTKIFTTGPLFRLQLPSFFLGPARPEPRKGTDIFSILKSLTLCRLPNTFCWNHRYPPWALALPRQPTTNPTTDPLVCLAWLSIWSSAIPHNERIITTTEGRYGAKAIIRRDYRKRCGRKWKLCAQQEEEEGRFEAHHHH
ncbi:hypothetical protein QBC36DRAFT_325266 [Triangularia setosa]|uniref:Uncharacterized protein n=1 Tax=Triangularia setosa TaxID=2587417 RepID=A0AAN6WA88_9PEZI|nr:hypothetical protein QBC36DRAFT_325266 [Podospora setosa]